VAITYYSATDIAAKLANPALASYGVADTASNVLSLLPSLSLDPRIASLQLTDTTTLSVSAAQFTAYQGTLDRLIAGQSLVVTGVTAAAAAVAQADTHVGKFTIVDTAANVVAALKSLGTAGKLTAITLTDTKTLAIEGVTFAAYRTTLDKLAPGHSMVLNGVSAGGAAAAQADALVASFTVNDTRQNVWNNLDALNADTRLTKITLTDGGPLNVTYAKFLVDGAAVAKIGAVTISDVTAAGAATAMQNPAVQRIQITDSLGQIGDALDALQGLAKAGQVSGIKLSVSGQTITLDQAQYLADRDAIALLPGGVLTVAGATTGNIAAIQADVHVKSFTLADTAANVLTAAKSLSVATKLGSIVLTDGRTLAVDGATFAAYRTTLDKLAPGHSMVVAGVSAAAAAAAQADGLVASFTVSDTAAGIANNLAALSASAKLGGISLVGGSVLALSGDSFATYQSTLDKLAAGTTITVAGASVAKAAIAQADSQISGFTVSDTAAAIIANLPALGLDTHLTSFRLTDATTLGVSGAQFSAYGNTLDKIVAGQSLTVTGVSVAGAAKVQADAHVAAFSVADTAANVLGNLAALKLDTRLGSIVLSDTDTLIVDGATFVAYKATLDKLAPGETMLVTGVNAANAGAAQADTHVGSFAVSDTKLNVWNNLDALNAATHLTKINLTDGGVLNVTYAKYVGDAAAVAKIGAVTVSDVLAGNATAVLQNAMVQKITVTDTLAHIGSSLDTLEALAKSGQLTGIKVSDVGQSLTLSQAQYDADMDALALLSGNYQVTPATDSNFVIKLQYNPSMASAPAAYKLALNEAVSYFEHLITSKATITLGVGYGEVGGASLGSGVLGAAGPTNGVNVTYAQFQAALASHATSDVQATAAHSLAVTASQAESALWATTHNTAGGALSPASFSVPTVLHDDEDELYFALSAAAAAPGSAGASAAAALKDPTHGGTIFVASAQAKALGLMAPNAPGLDGVMGFSSSYKFAYDADNRGVSGYFDFIGVAEHEITHALGRVALLGSGYDSVLDLFRYSADGVHALNPSTRSYFSIDGGKTNLAWFATSSDLGDWASTPTPDANSAFATGGAVNVFSKVDIVEMNALGYALA